MNPHPNALSDDPICPNCGGSVHVRNPTGSCDHLYWPELLTPEAKAKIGTSQLTRLQRLCMDEAVRAFNKQQEKS